MPHQTTTQCLSHRRDTLLAMYTTQIFPRLMDWVLRGARFQTERRHNRDAVIRNLYLVGAGTHPGAGVPYVLAGAKLTAGLMLEG